MRHGPSCIVESSCNRSPAPRGFALRRCCHPACAARCFAARPIPRETNVRHQMSMALTSDAERSFLEGLDVRRSIARRKPDDSSVEAQSHEALATYYKKTRQYKKAHAALRAALEIREFAGATDANREALLRALAESFNDLGNLASDSGWFQPAAEAYREATRIRRNLARK